MKTTRKVFMFLLIITCITMLLGCSEKKDMIDIDISYLSNELFKKAEFEDELSAVDDTVIKKIYDINDFVKAQVYISSGATAEEIALFEFDNKETATEGLKKALVRIGEQKTDFESYMPKEIRKLDRAVVKQSGKYVIVCISNSSEAEKIITQYINNIYKEIE